MTTMHTVNITGDLAPFIAVLPSNIKESLLKTDASGDTYIVPPSTKENYITSLQREIDVAAALIERPSAGRELGTAIILIVATMLFIGDWLGLDGLDWFIAYGCIISAGVIRYVMSHYKVSEQTAALTKIRTALVNEFSSH